MLWRRETTSEASPTDVGCKIVPQLNATSVDLIFYFPYIAIFFTYKNIIMEILL
jgi:hypothetical protein